MLSAVIFDLDGVLVDSTPIQLEANRLFLEKHGKFHISPVSGREGMRIIDIIEEYKDIYSMPEPIEALYMERQEIFFALVKEQLELMPGAFELLQRIKKRNLKLALATSGDKNYIAVLFAKFPELKTVFDVIVASEDVVAGKPNPEVYIKTSEKLSVPAESCVVVEDSFNGIAAAKAAKMQVICVPNSHYPDADYSQADRIFPSLSEVAAAIAV